MYRPNSFRQSALRNRSQFSVWRSLALVILIFASFGFIVTAKIKPNFEQSVRSHFTEWVSPLAEIIVQPLQIAQQKINKIIAIWQRFGELAALQGELSQWRELNNQLQDLRYENQNLRKLLNYSPEPQYEIITSRVIGRSGPLAQELIVNSGNNLGIEAGQSVIDGQGLVGRVISSDKTSARVLLISDRRSRLAAQTRVEVNSSLTATHFLVTGAQGPYLKIQYLPQDAQLKENMEVVTLGEEGGLPAGLVFGHLVKLQNDEKPNSESEQPTTNQDVISSMANHRPNNSGDQIWYIRPVANLSSPDFVRILRNNH